MADRKGVATRHTLSILAAAGGTANDTTAATFAYDPFARRGATAASPGLGYDFAAEEVQEMCFITAVALTGQITNFVSPRVVHRNAAGAIVDNISVAFSAAGVVTVAFVAVNLGVNSGAVVPGAGTGTLTVTTGSALPWSLSAGDTVTFDRLSNNGTGLATPAMALTFLLAGKGS